MIGITEDMELAYQRKQTPFGETRGEWSANSLRYCRCGSPVNTTTRNQGSTTAGIAHTIKALVDICNQIDWTKVELTLDGYVRAEPCYAI